MDVSRGSVIVPVFKLFIYISVLCVIIGFFTSMGVYYAGGICLFLAELTFWTYQMIISKLEDSHGTRLVKQESADRQTRREVEDYVKESF